MDALVWHFRTSSGLEILGPLWLPLVVGLALYYSSYLPIFVRILWRKAAGVADAPALEPENRLAALVVLPTLLRKPDELAGLERAIESVLHNGYPGPLVVCAAIDDLAAAGPLTEELRRWLADRPRRPGLTLMVAGTDERRGKAMAIEAGIDAVRAAVDRGELDAFPEVFINMDADSELSDRALERMVVQLTRRGRLLRQRPMIVASNVCVRRDHYWSGWRAFFTTRGQLALQVAREYMTSISLARHNIRLIPVTSVSGALYCTWSELYLQGPRYAGYLRTLRLRHWLRWWLGWAPPSFSRSGARPCPEAMTGPGDDTYVAWLALQARWRRGRITLELPRTPFHALAALVRSYLFRPIAYDPAAKVFTATPTSIEGLYRQRVRWNSSRVWLLQRFGWSMGFHWSAGAVVYFDVLLLVGLHAVILAALLLWPLADRPTQWLALALTANVAYAFVRGAATLLAMVQDDDVRGQWHKLLALPLSGLYHLVFNIVTTVHGLTKDLLGSGVNTGFSPEHTLIAAGTGRLALAYRLRRFALLAWRSARYGDVPLGRFWIGWQATRWTRDGYAGWTDASQAGPPVLPSPKRRRARSGRAA